MKHRWTTSLSLILTRGLSTLFSLSPDHLPSRRGGHPSRSPASAAGRPAGLARLAGARRGLVRSARVLAAVAWLSLLGALALPTPAQAQTTGICDRTQQVQNEILMQLSAVSDCAAVTDADLASVTLLVLESKSITSLKAGDFDGLTAVTAIVLTDNQLGALPANLFSGLTSLTNLSLDSSGVTSLHADTFSGLTAVAQINLTDNQLGALPANLFSGLTSLTNLEMGNSGAGITLLPAGVFFGLSELEYLNLSGNGFPSLPAGVFSGLSKLETLLLSDTQLASLPAGVFSGLTALEQLYLNNSQLTSLPAGVFSGLTALRILDLRGNPTTPMPLTVTLEKVGTDRVRAKVLAGAPFAVDIPVTLVGGTLAGGATKLGVKAGSVEGFTVPVTRTAGTAAAVTVDVDLNTQPTLPTGHRGYAFARASSGLPATILPDATMPPTVESVAVKSAPQSGDTYGWGETIVFTLTFSEKVRVTGQPQPTLAFDLGGSTREARYAGITDTDVDRDPRPRPRPEGVKVHFAYTVQPGDRDINGIQVGALARAIELGGARIQSAADRVDADGHQVDGVDADLAHAALGRLPGHKVDGGTAQPPAGSGITIIDTHGHPLANHRLTIREGTRGRYGLKLNTRPTHTVRVAAIASDGDPDLQVLPTAEATKAITPDEWETPFYMELRAAIDDDDENGERVFLNRAYSTDPAYHDLILPDVVVVEAERRIADDEETMASSSAQAEAADEEEETAPAEGPALTARFADVPSGHDGARAFTLRIAFSEAIAIGYEAFRDHSVGVSGGAVTKARRVDKRRDLWEITVKPASDAAVSVSLSPPPACDETGAICTGDGRPLSVSIATIVLGPAQEAEEPEEEQPEESQQPEEEQPEEEQPEEEEQPQEPPPAPQNLTGVANSDGSITLSWDAPDDDTITGYQILRRRPYFGEDELLTYVADTGSTATSYTDTEATPKVRHVYRVKAINPAGVGHRSNSISVTAAAAKVVAASSGLAPNFPNPFNSRTLIPYRLATPGAVRLEIYNLLGQPLRTLVDQYQDAGFYKVRWDARDRRGAMVSAGMYLVRLHYPGGVQTKRLLYLK